MSLDSQDVQLGLAQAKRMRAPRKPNLSWQAWNLNALAIY